MALVPEVMLQDLAIGSGLAGSFPFRFLSLVLHEALPFSLFTLCVQSFHVFLLFLLTLSASIM